MEGWWRWNDSISFRCAFLCGEKVGSLAVSGIAHSISNCFVIEIGAETSGTLKAIPTEQMIQLQR